jgi:RNAse (barnase) inhibitor barstar
MPYPTIYDHTTPKPVIYTYKLLASPNKELFYDEVERVLCGGLRSGFGRNLDALNDVFSGGYGYLNTHQKNCNIVHIHIGKSKLLNERVAKVIQNAVNTESLFELFFT